MKDKLKGAAITAAAIAALAVGGAAIAGASGGGSDNKTDKPAAGQESDRGNDRSENPDKPITGQALQRAKAVALQATGGGKVTDSEVNDEEGAYEVEVTRADGSQVDVHLDRSFHVTGSDADREDAGGDDGR